MIRTFIQAALLLFLLGHSQQLNAQQVLLAEVNEGVADSLPRTAVPIDVAANKKLPAGYEQEAMEALMHFPSLQHVPIRFSIRKSFSTLKTRPTFLSMLMPRGHRSYVIIISNKTTAKLMPLLFENLGREARIGVMGHELSHVEDFATKSGWQCFVSAIGHLFPRYLDRFEYHTDMICIQHGLGKDLEAWSSYIRNTMHTVFWRGSDYVHRGDTQYERYMNPATIEQISRQTGMTVDAAR